MFSISLAPAGGSTAAPPPAEPAAMVMCPPPSVLDAAGTPPSARMVAAAAPAAVPSKASLVAAGAAHTTGRHTRTHTHMRSFCPRYAKHHLQWGLQEHVELCTFLHAMQFAWGCTQDSRSRRVTLAYLCQCHTASDATLGGGGTQHRRYSKQVNTEHNTHVPMPMPHSCKYSSMSTAQSAAGQ